MKARPTLKVIICSGYSIDGPAQEIIDAGAEGFLQTPFVLKDLKNAMGEVLDR
jgi:two-component system, cell cycle sensor histidine kinase and response regulator CckA